MIYVFDIDGTLCTLVKNADYKKAQPLSNRIEKVNKLYDEGNTIIFFTARGYVTKIDWRELTLNQLEEWNVKYHELILGKPNADVYVDDKAINDLDFFND